MRKSISQKEIIKMSYEIFFQLKKIFFIWEKTYYHIFLPIREYKEIDTFIIINFLLKIGKCVTVPCSNFHKLSIENCLLHENTILIKKKYGILEPISKHKYIISISIVEVIFIPLLIFDSRGYRIGYGKGFYDRFIPLCEKNAIKIGLSFFYPIRKIKGIHKNDLLIDIGVTPDHIFLFKKFNSKENFENIPSNDKHHN
ncbi:5-formyltetrahydrofolate cyclo-ligase [Blattabacterium sp. (Blaberus giganteus)]|uniref:5-formyltetrahydrofolate cyclo-ligase n=1 Tax=Blattabacterium sp. (Blaberus giganteus) TaxID=1186051 RepID=UPI00025F6FF7|nr:5-formyltetrahydrofolate cyclo-ligase [Blattabacterium sp. (Blaberus giganteus)]AFJ90925.1 5-formyltetrahydrofolate cyclo-ligase [Blattabacterium sp. (Blaberus giganteus)]